MEFCLDKVFCWGFFVTNVFREKLSQMLKKSDNQTLFTSTGLGVLPGVATGTGLKPKSGKIFNTLKQRVKVDAGLGFLH